MIIKIQKSMIVKSMTCVADLLHAVSDQLTINEYRSFKPIDWMIHMWIITMFTLWYLICNLL